MHTYIDINIDTYIYTYCTYTYIHISGIYWFKQVSWRNRVSVSLDWIKARLFGRDLGALY